jgi:hypothetical protein
MGPQASGSERGSHFEARRLGAIEMDDERWNIVIDEPRLTEWMEYGFRQLDRYLLRHAAFTEWLDAHRDDR